MADRMNAVFFWHVNRYTTPRWTLALLRFGFLFYLGFLGPLCFLFRPGFLLRLCLLVGLFEPSEFGSPFISPSLFISQVVKPAGKISAAVINQCLDY